MFNAPSCIAPAVDPYVTKILSPLTNICPTLLIAYTRDDVLDVPITRLFPETITGEFPTNSGNCCTKEAVEVLLVVDVVVCVVSEVIVLVLTAVLVTVYVTVVGALVIDIVMSTSTITVG